jgi:alkanesulfonate monooxygenase SsuD/methylene tetrahydromethanopterin reductase-like flavin-dependent oxidoreductase (luciferase family)
MAHPRRFRFAADLQAPLPGLTWLESAREMEQLGYSTILFPDHFHEGPGPIAAMAAVAAVTESVHVGVLVFDCDFRHPAVLARELATIDAMSGAGSRWGWGRGGGRSTTSSPASPWTVPACG